MAGGLKGPRVIAKIQMPKFDGLDDDNKPKFTEVDDGDEVIIYWKKGVIEWLGDAVEEMDPLEYTGYTESDIYSATKKDDDTSEGADAYEVKFSGVKLSKFPRGSVRQQSLKLRLTPDVEFTEYENGEALDTAKTIRTLSLSYSKKYRINILEWFNFFKTIADKASVIEKLITPDGDSINMVDD